MTFPEQIGVAIALAACAGLNCYLTALLLAVGYRLQWPGMAGFELLSPTGVMIAMAALFLIEFSIDKLPRVNLWWGWPQLVVRPLAGALFAVLALGEAAGMGAKVGVVIAGAAIALAVHLGRTRVRRCLNRSPEPFSNVAASVAGDAIVVALFTLAMRVPFAAGGAGLLLAGVAAAVAMGCCCARGREPLASELATAGADGDDGLGADDDEADGVEA
jgi:hypothetical protein